MAGHVRVIAQKVMDERGIMDTDGKMLIMAHPLVRTLTLLPSTHTRSLAHPAHFTHPLNPQLHHHYTSSLYLITLPTVRDVGTVLRMGISLGSPRACLRADALASHPLCSFVHVNCDDLTATAFGVSKEVTPLEL